MNKTNLAIIYCIFSCFLSVTSPLYAETSTDNQVLSKNLLTVSEKSWIKANPIIHVGASTDWMPFSFTNAKGEHAGISHDYLELISKYTGLTFSYTIDSWPDQLAKIKTGEIDLLPAVYRTDDREQFLNFSKAYFESLNYFFIHESIKAKTIADLDGKTLAILREHAYVDIISKNFPKIKILEVDSFDAAIDAVLEKRADILYDTYSVLTYTLEQSSIKTIVPFKSTRSLGKSAIHIALAKNNKVLGGIINKGLAAITDTEHAIILNDWLGEKSNTKTFIDSLTPAEIDWLSQHSAIYYGAERDWAPYDYVNFQGEHTGLSKDYLDVIADILKVDFIPVIDSWTNLLTQIKQKKIELLPALYSSEERESFLKFSDPYQSTFDYIFKRSDAKLDESNIWENKTIAITKGDTHIVFFKEHYPNVNVLEVDGLEHAISAVLDKTADLFIGSYAVVNLYLKNNGIGSIQPYKSFLSEKKRFLYMATYKENDLLISLINKAIKAIPPKVKNHINQKWLVGMVEQENDSVVLTPSERIWLNENRVITIVGDPAWLPYEAKDSQGNYIGIVAEYLDIFAKKLNIKFKFLPTNTWQESLTLANSGSVDMLSIIKDSTLVKGFEFTDTYLSSPLVFVMKNDDPFVSNIEQIENRTIALIKGYSYVEEIIEAYPNIKFHYVDTIEKGMIALSTGKIDALISSLPQASYHISKIGGHNLRIVGSTPFYTNLSFGVNTNMTPLISILNKTLKSISPKEKKEIFDTWGTSQFITKTDYVMVAKIVGGFALILLFVIYWNRKLSNEVGRRKEAEQQIELILDKIPEQIIITALNGDIVKVNHKTKFDYNITDDEIVNLNITDFYADIRDGDKITKQLKEFGKIDQLIVDFTRFDNSIYSMMISVIPIKYQRKPSFLTIAVNVTERLAIEKELEQAKLSAEHANNAKSEFLANMSHEIRTPMNAIIGFTELLSEQIVDKKLSVFVKTIQLAGNSLLMIINDILDLSKIEAGKLTLSIEPTSLHALFDEIGNVFLMKVKSKNIDLLLNLENNVPESLLLDKTRLRQILFNLVGNAVKFTDVGSVALNAKIISQSNTSVDLEISVVDSGIGITEQDQKYIFDSFRQREGQSERKYGGTGLGLTISRRLTQLMHGDLEVKSVLGHGSQFSVIIPNVGISSEQDTENEDNNANKYQRLDFLGASILIVDDIEDNRSLLIEIFSNLSVQLHIATNGKEAVLLAKKFPIDFVLMDIRMPEMDGYDAAQLIKKDNPNVPIVALTASVMRDDYERQRRENFDGYLRKPLLRKELLDELCKHLDFTATKDMAESKDVNEFDGVRFKLVDQTLFKEVADKFLSPCQNLQKNNRINAIIEFSDELTSWGQEHNEPGVLTFSEELNLAANIFDIAKIKYLLSEFSRQYDV